MNLKEMVEVALAKRHIVSRFILDDNFYGLVDEYVSMIKKWGAHHNIVSGKYGDDDMLLAVYDSLIGGSFLSLPQCIYDAGAGGGFPGLVLAMAAPTVEVTLVEANRKKCSFLRMVKAQLGLTQVKIANERIENMPKLSFIVTKAAFSPGNIGIVGDALLPGGHLAIWATPKNRHDFLEGLNRVGMGLIGEYGYEVPGMGERVILLLEQQH